MAVLLFGASKAGESFIRHNPTLNIVAVADNDVRRHDSLIQGIPVIAPEAIQHYTFDKIIITSQWVDAIKAQLTQALNIAPESIVVPAKQQLKADAPFAHAATRELAHALLHNLNDFLSDHGIKACLDSGTLLGAVRDDALITWDDDIDLAVDAADFDKLLQVLPTFHARLPSREAVNWRFIKLSLDGRPCCINIEFSNASAKTSQFIPFDLSLQMREIQGEYSELVSSAGLFFAPALHFEHFEKRQFLGGEFYTPAEPEKFLTFMYGDWRTPVKATRITEYQNRRADRPLNSAMTSVTKTIITTPKC